MEAGQHGANVPRGWTLQVVLRLPQVTNRDTGNQQGILGCDWGIGVTEALQGSSSGLYCNTLKNAGLRFYYICSSVSPCRVGTFHQWDGNSSIVLFLFLSPPTPSPLHLILHSYQNKITCIHTNLSKEVLLADEKVQSNPNSIHNYISNTVIENHTLYNCGNIKVFE